MNGRALSAIILLLVLLATGLVSTPAFSGEHPWDSDVTGGDETTVADYEWDSRAADSAQLDVGSVDIDDTDSGTAGTAGTAVVPSVEIDISTIILGFVRAISIGI